MSSLDVPKLLSMAQVLLAEQRVKPLFRLIVRTSLTLTGAHDVALLLPGRGECWLLAGQGTLEQRDTPQAFAPQQIKENQLPHTLLVRARDQQMPVSIQDPLTQEPFSRDPYFKANATADALAHPLRWNGRLQAILYLERGAGAAPFRQEERRRLSDMGGHMAFALANLDQTQYTDSRVQDLEAEVGDMNRTLSARKKETAVILADATAAARGRFAAKVLHQLGNEINSISLLADMLDEQVKDANVDRLVKANAMLTENKHRLAEFFTEDRKGQLLPQYYVELGQEMTRERNDLVADLARLREQISLMKDLLDHEREMARQDLDLQTVEIGNLLSELFRLESARLPYGGVTLHHNDATCGTLVRCPRVHALFLLKYLVKKVIEAQEPKSVDQRSLDLRIHNLPDERVQLCLVPPGGKPPHTPISAWLKDRPSSGDTTFFKELHEATQALARAGTQVFVAGDAMIDQFALDLPAARL